jgi:hypothetical protein
MNPQYSRAREPETRQPTPFAERFLAVIIIAQFLTFLSVHLQAPTTRADTRPDAPTETSFTIRVHREGDSSLVDYYATLFFPLTVEYGSYFSRPPSNWWFCADTLDEGNGQFLPWPGINKCRLRGPAGFAQVPEGESPAAPTLPFVTVYGKRENNRRLFFKIGTGRVTIFRDNLSIGRTMDIELCKEWDTYIHEVSPSPDHPDGGIEIDVPEMRPDDIVQWPEFYIDFSQCDPFADVDFRRAPVPFGTRLSSEWKLERKDLDSRPFAFGTDMFSIGRKRVQTPQN